MRSSRANSSLFAVFILLLVIAGVIYLFWQTTIIQEGTVQMSDTDPKTEVVITPSNNEATKNSESEKTSGTISIESEGETSNKLDEE